MKKMLIATSLLCLAAMAKSQTFGEWFSQNKTQKKYLQQQIALFQVYLGYLKKGYEVAKEGTEAISSFKNGEFFLHKGYFSSLNTVSPAVKSNGGAAAVLDLQARIIEVFNSAISTIQAGNESRPGELQYIRRVKDNLLAECLAGISELNSVLRDGGLQMKDDERLKRIAAIHASMQDRYSFAHSFTAEAVAVTRQRARERTGIRITEQLYKP